jgi:hypothetical protein
MMPIAPGPALLAVMIGTALPHPAAAQVSRIPGAVPRPFMAIAHRDLTFGQVLPGIPEAVRPDDLRHAGLFEIQGSADAAVRVEFLLPDALVAPFGALLPIAFGHGDGFADFSHGRPPRGLRFDPRTPLITTLGPNGRLLIRLGGTVSPTRDQPGGPYHAAVSITVYDLGI